jgi:hypothetical protein
MPCDVAVDGQFWKGFGGRRGGGVIYVAILSVWEVFERLERSCLGFRLRGQIDLIGKRRV